MLILLAVAALAVSEPPPAAETEAAPPASGGAPAAAPLAPGQRREKMVCRMEIETGSRFSKRVCLTLEDFKRRTRESEEGFAEMQRNHNVNRSPGN